MHPEEAKLASGLLSFFGVIVALMGAIMWLNLIRDSEVDASGAATQVWFGFAVVVHGMSIKKTRKLMPKPRWTYVAFLLGIISMYGLHHSILEDDVVAVLFLIPMQVLALLALWHSSWKQAAK